MRYLSLRVVSVLYKAAGIVAAATSLVLFFYFEVGAVQTMNEIAKQGINVSTEAYLAAMSIPMLFFMGGLFISLLTYSAGAFIGLMVDVANSVSNIEWWFTRRDMDLRPETPPTPAYQPRRDERRLARRGKWDTG